MRAEQIFCIFITSTFLERKSLPRKLKTFLKETGSPVKVPSERHMATASELSKSLTRFGKTTSQAQGSKVKRSLSFWKISMRYSYVCLKAYQTGKFVEPLPFKYANNINIQEKILTALKADIRGKLNSARIGVSNESEVPLDIGDISDFAADLERNTSVSSGCRSLEVTTRHRQADRQELEDISQSETLGIIPGLNDSTPQENTPEEIPSEES
ncbi:hypothetical protein BDZ91DRAFT_767135 [Kalaharituber pfeilii]|nr:hypothetical protein BDZ91DRAFT_767135 [Kalaharituber pfeilii]